MTTKTREEILVEAVRMAKTGSFGLTGIKVEFEARFNRNSAPRNGCRQGCTRGRWECSYCDGSGLNDLDACDNCEGTGQEACNTCLGTVYPPTTGVDWNDMKAIHDRILRKLVRLGLAERIPRGSSYTFGHKYRPIAPLVFSKVYEDTTVDTEQTLTLLMDNPENVLLFPKLLKAFYSLKDEIGQEVDVSTAGMHISLLNSYMAYYPIETSRENLAKFENFRKSMILLMPALYFLGSCDEKSRRLNYREPMIAQRHTAAINYAGGALEFRVFDTCYEYPDTILDNIVVALNCLRFWTKKYTRNYLVKVANNVSFGKKDGDDLKRHYVTNAHIDLLNRGLRMIKPAYLSVSEIKKQRKFTMTKHDTKNQEKLVKQQVEDEYKIYEKRVGWQTVMQEHNYIRRLVEDKYVYANGAGQRADIEPYSEQAMKDIEEQAKALAKSEVIKQSLDKFSADNLPRIGKTGEYELCVG